MHERTRIQTGIEKDVNLIGLLPEVVKLSPKEANFKTPFIINISGQSAAGKSTISELLSKEIEGCSVINMDDYLKGWGIGPLNHDSGNPNKPYFAGLNPAVYDLQKLHNDMVKIKEGKSIERPIFDEIQKKPNGIKIFNPSNIIILDGIYALEQPFLGMADLSILVEAPLHDRLIRKMVRNSFSYKEDVNQIIFTYLTRDEPTYSFYKEDMRQNADFVAHNPANPNTEFALCQGKDAGNNSGEEYELSPKIEYGTPHTDEQLSLVKFVDDKMLVQYKVGEKILVRSEISILTYELLKEIYAIRELPTK